MADRPSSPRDHYTKHLGRLMGCRITAIVVDDSDPSEIYTGYRLHDPILDIDYELVALADPEGNGPGHLSITLIKKDASK
jgi:hypothetical protein